jgi:hypothetical protein
MMQSVHDPLTTYAKQMTLLPKLTKQSFDKTLTTRKSDPKQFAKKLCEISIRFIFDEIQAFYPSNLKIPKLDFVQACNTELLKRAKAFSGESYLQWRKILKAIVRGKS